MDHDSAADSSSSGRWHTVRYDRMRRLRSRRTARLLFRDAAVFKNANVTRDDIGPFMRQYAEEHDILSKPRVMLVGSFRGVKILLATPLLRWYLMHGLMAGRVYQIIEYEPNPCFRRFGESVSMGRRPGDEDNDKAIIADTMKLLGNSGYGKTVTNVDRHRDVKYCTEIGTSALINNKRFRQLVEQITETIFQIVIQAPTFAWVSLLGPLFQKNNACQAKFQNGSHFPTWTPFKPKKCIFWRNCKMFCVEIYVYGYGDAKYTTIERRRGFLL